MLKLKPERLNFEQLNYLFTLAANAAQQAGLYIADFNQQEIEVQIKEAGNSLASQVVTQVDLACEKIIYEILKPSCEQFNIAFLAEESASQYLINEHPRLGKPYFWCVDPLDGTLPFTENRHGYAVSIALLNRAGTPILAAIYDPTTKTLYQAVSNLGDFTIKASLLKQSTSWQPNLSASHTPLTLYVDRSFTTLPVYSKVVKLMQLSAHKLGYVGLEIFHHGGAVMNAVQVLENAPGCYFKFPKAKAGGGSIWDFSATSALMSAAGGWVSDIYGDPLRLNESDSLFMNKYGVLFASDKHIAKEIMQIFKALAID